MCKDDMRQSLRSLKTRYNNEAPAAPPVWYICLLGEQKATSGPNGDIQAWYGVALWDIRWVVVIAFIHARQVGRQG